MTTNDRNDRLGRILLAGNVLNKSLGADYIQSGDTKQTLWVEFTGLLHDFCSDGNGRVDWIRDDQNEGFRAVLCDPFNEVANDASVDLEEIVTGHARLSCFSVSSWIHGFKLEVRTRNASRDDHDVCSSQGLLQAIISREITCDFLLSLSHQTLMQMTLKAHTAIEEMWERSAVTPGVLTTS